MFKKTWFLLLIPVALYSTTEKSKATLEKIFQEHIVNDSIKRTASDKYCASEKEVKFYEKSLKKEEEVVEKAFQENIINNPMWDELLTPTGQEEFLKCVKDKENCNIPLVATLSTDPVLKTNHRGNREYDSITDKFSREITKNEDNNENVNMIIDKYLEKYLTKKGRTHFCIPGKTIDELQYGTALKSLKKVYELLYRTTHYIDLFMVKYSIVHFKSK
ncbi:MAG TPA: hypothetical protein VL201_03060 [Patescibacteria group bacterium]|jgi:hypothetical protein|nr:hypothetical protein [Patescibacteria group bacterium]